MPRDFPFPGAKIVFIDNPADVHNLLSEIFGEDFPVGKNPTESDADFPIGKDDLAAECAECPVKDCDERLAAYEGADEPDGKMLRALKDKAFRDAMRTEKLKLDIVEREAQLARQAIRSNPPYLWSAPSAEEFAKGVEALSKALGVASPKVPKDRIMTPKFKVSFPFMEKPAEPKGEKYKVNLDLGKPFESLKERIDATLADVRKAEKKRKDAELDDLAGRLFKKMSHQFYRDRGLRLSRINELTRHVSELFEENRTLKHNLRDKEEVLGYYKKAVANPESITWNTSGRSASAAFIFVTTEEFETLKALKAGTAKVVPADKPAEPGWFDFIDPETGKLVLPMQYVTVEVSDPRVNGGRVQTLVRVFEAEGVRFTYRPGGVNVFFTSPNGIVTPFGFEQAKWRYKAPGNQPPVPDDIPLNNLV